METISKEELLKICSQNYENVVRERLQKAKQSFLRQVKPMIPEYMKQIEKFREQKREQPSYGLDEEENQTEEPPQEPSDMAIESSPPFSNNEAPQQPLSEEEQEHNLHDVDAEEQPDPQMLEEEESMTLEYKEESGLVEDPAADILPPGANGLQSIHQPSQSSDPDNFGDFDDFDDT